MTKIENKFIEEPPITPAVEKLNEMLDEIKNKNNYCKTLYGDPNCEICEGIGYYYKKIISPETFLSNEVKVKCKCNKQEIPDPIYWSVTPDKKEGGNQGCKEDQYTKIIDNSIPVWEVNDESNKAVKDFFDSVGSSGTGCFTILASEYNKIIEEWKYVYAVEMREYNKSISELRAVCKTSLDAEKYIKLQLEVYPGTIELIQIKKMRLQ